MSWIWTHNLSLFFWFTASEYPFGIFKLIAGGDRHWFHSMQVQLPYNHGHNLPLSLVTKFTSIWWWSVVLLMNHTLLRPVAGVLLQDRMFQPCLSSGFLRLTFYLMHCYKLVFVQWHLYIAVSEYNNIHTGVRIMVFNATFNYISVLLWQSVLLVEETGVPGENHRPVTSHWQTILKGNVNLNTCSTHK
jgi:hypothetical protein